MFCPSKRSSLPEDFRSYWNLHDKLVTEDGISLKNHNILMPASLRKNYLNIMHTGHQVINKILQKARNLCSR